MSGADDDAFVLQGFKHPPPVPHVHEDEVALAGDVGEAQALELGVEVVPALGVQGDGAGDMGGVTESGGGGGLGREVDVERRAGRGSSGRRFRGA